MSEPLKQIAALPIVETPDGPLVLLITTRGRGRWTIPRGWPKPGTADNEMAAKEAADEAGVDGKIGPNTIDAVRAFQVANGLTPDGYASLNLLNRLR